jgi:hypothetical protein
MEKDTTIKKASKMDYNRNWCIRAVILLQKEDLKRKKEK